MRHSIPASNSSARRTPVCSHGAPAPTRGYCLGRAGGGDAGPSEPGARDMTARLVCHSAAFRGEVCDAVAVGTRRVRKPGEEPGGVDEVLSGEPGEAGADSSAERNDEGVGNGGEFGSEEPGAKRGQQRRVGEGSGSTSDRGRLGCRECPAGP